MEILILGSLPKNKEEENLYNLIVGICKKHASDISSPIDTAQFNGTDEERYERAVKKVEEADLIIGEQSSPSTGQGVEIGIAITLNKPLIIISNTEETVSGLIKGCPILKETIIYPDTENLKLKLVDILPKYL